MYERMLTATINSGMSENPHPKEAQLTYLSPLPLGKGHTFQVVGWGPGLFGTTTRWNLKNPMRRDTVTIPAFSHAVIRFEADNPGLWALHCHVAWHMEGMPVFIEPLQYSPCLILFLFSRLTWPMGIPSIGGMFVSLAERPADLVTLVETMDPETRSLSQSFCSAG